MDAVSSPTLQPSYLDELQALQELEGPPPVRALSLLMADLVTALSLLCLPNVCGH